VRIGHEVAPTTLDWL